MLIEKCTRNHVDILAEDDLRLLGKGPRKLLPPMLLPITASNISFSFFISQKYDSFPPNA